MKLQNALSLKSYYAGGFLGKSISPTWRFYVTFIDKSMLGIGNTSLMKRVGPMPIINHWHVLNVTIPQYDFKKEVQYYGPLPKSFPYLDFDGFELKIEFEDDQQGTIGYFINWLQRRVVDQRGLYTPPEQLKLQRIIVQTEDHQGLPVGVYTFYGAYFLNSSEVTYDYASSQSVKYTVTFNCDYMNSFFPKKTAVGTTISTVGKIAQGIKLSKDRK